MTSQIPTGALHEVMLVVVAEANWLLENNSFVLQQLHANPRPVLVRQLLPPAILRYTQNIHRPVRRV